MSDKTHDQVIAVAQMKTFKDWLDHQDRDDAEAWSFGASRLYETTKGAKLILDSLGVPYTAADVLALNDRLVQVIAQTEHHLACDGCRGEGTAERVARIVENVLNAVRSSKPASGAGSETPTPEVSG